MQLVLRNKWVSLRGSSYVRDMNDNDVMYVQGKFWTFTRKKFLKDMDGNVKYVIRNKFWTLFRYSAFIMDKDEKIITQVKRKIFSLHDSYFLDTPYGHVTFIGNILGYDYHIKLNDVEIGHVSRKISLRDSFVLDIDDNVDVYFFVALLVAMDNITDQMNEEAAAASSSF